MKIRFNHVNFSYDKKGNNVLDDVNLEFNKSEIVFIMGHTGSGKSTLIQHINGLLIANEGTVVAEIDGKEYCLSRTYKEEKINELRKNIGLVFQFPEYQLFETTVLKDVMFGPSNFYKDKDEIKNMAVKSLNLVGIDESYYEKSPFDLSGGEKRKVAIAGVLASDPQVVIMDEPTSSLDPLAKVEMMKIIKELKEMGKLIVVISHDTDLAYEYADRVIIMEKGKVLLDTKTSEAFNDLYILNKASLVEPFVCKIKRLMKIKDNSITSIKQLKEVIKHG